MHLSIMCIEMFLTFIIIKVCILSLFSSFIYIYCDLQDRAIMFLPVHIVIGNKFFLDPQLTFTKNHVKLEVEGSSSFSGPLSFEWTFADIVSIESAWDEEVSLKFPFQFAPPNAAFTYLFNLYFSLNRCSF